MKKILICGAGIAGLALARQLEKLNISFKIIERRPELTTEGAGIALPFNAMKALRHMDLGDVIDQHSYQVNRVIYTDATGAILNQASLLEPPLNSDHFVALHRHKFSELLCKGIKESIHFGVTIEKIRPSKDGVLVKFNKPELAEEEFEVVVGADGIHSRVKALAFSQASVVDFGFTVWRWTCKYPNHNLQPTYMIGNEGNVLMIYPIGKDEVYCYAQARSVATLELNKADHQQALIREFAHFDGIAKSILEKLPENSAIISGILSSVAEPLFTTGRVVLIGDASHACSPVLQQGAACALEDAIVLSELLKCFPPQDALSYYEKLRSERVRWIVTASDGPIKAQMNATPQIMAAVHKRIRDYGPFNVQGWKYLLSVDPLAELSKFIAGHSAHKNLIFETEVQDPGS